MGGVHVTAEAPIHVASLTFRADPAVLPLLSRSAHPGRELRAYVATVVAKVWYRITRANLAITTVDEALSSTDRPYTTGSRGAFAPADLLPLKVRPEVLLVGSAEAPQRRAVPTLESRLRLGSVDKRVHVFGDRWIDGSGRLHGGAPFSTMPLVYERAAAGTWNPVGVRPASDPAFIPNLTSTTRAPTSIAEIGSLAPACFGPIPWSWPVRASQPAQTILGRSGATGDFTTEVVHLTAATPFAVFNAASPDQQLAQLRGDERLALDNFIADEPHLDLDLPRVAMVGSVKGDAHPFPMALDTIWIDTDRRLCSLTFRGHIGLSDAREDVAVRVQMRGATTSGSTTITGDMPTPSAKPPRSSKPGKKRGGATQAFSLADVGPVSLPFAKANEAPAQTRDSTLGPRGGLPFQAGDGQAGAHEAAPSADPQMRSTLDMPDGAARLAEKLAARAARQSAPPPAVVSSAAPTPTGPAAVAHQPGRVAAGPAAISPAALFAPSAPAPAVAIPAMVIPSQVAPPTASAVPAPAFPAAVDGSKRAYEAYTPTTGGTPLPAAVVAPRAERLRQDTIVLLFFEPRSLPFIRVDASYRPLLEALQERPLDPDLDDPDAAENPAEMEDRREIESLLASASPLSDAEIRATLRRSLESVRFNRPLVTIEGTLEAPADEIDLLRATVAVAASHASEAPAVQEVMTTARAFLASPGIPSAPDVALGLVHRVRAAFERAQVTTAIALEEAAEPALLEKPSRVVRSVLGKRCVRARIQLTGSREPPLSAYLSEEMSCTLPAVRRVPIRAIARVHAGLEEHDAQPLALELLALGLKTPPLSMVH